LFSLQITTIQTTIIIIYDDNYDDAAREHFIMKQDFQWYTVHMIFAFQILINKENPEMHPLHDISKATFSTWGSHSYSTIFWDVTPVFCQFLSWFTLHPWRWRQHSSPKQSWTSTGLHGIIIPGDSILQGTVYICIICICCVST
jgi:hypothetical protein